MPSPSRAPAATVPQVHAAPHAKVPRSTLIVFAYSPGEFRDPNLDYFLKQALIPQAPPPVVANLDDGAGGAFALARGLEAPVEDSSRDAGGSSAARRLDPSPGTVPLQDIGPDGYFHFLIVVNGQPPPATKERFDQIAAAMPNFEVHYRSNSGYDFCAHREALLDLLPDGKLCRPPSSFTSVILLNGSVRGPFLAAGETRPWPYFFLRLLEQNRVRLAGLSINCMPDPMGDLHIQSMLLAFRMRDTPILLDRIVCVDDKDALVMTTEVGISRAIIEAGGNLGVTQLYWRGHDFLNFAATKERCAPFLDPAREATDTFWIGPGGGYYAGIELNPLELVFFKTNRGVAIPYQEKYTQWQLETRPWSLPAEFYA